MRQANAPSATLAILCGLICLTGFAVSCSSEGEAEESSEPTSSTAAGEVADTTETTAEVADAADPDAEIAAIVVFDVLPTEPTAPGPRPELAWSAVEGALSYDLIVLDANGEPYWAWTGEATSVYLGGVENPDAIGAWVFEPLTWIVTARDNDGQPLAVSEQAELLP